MSYGEKIWTCGNVWIARRGENWVVGFEMDGAVEMTPSEFESLAIFAINNVPRRCAHGEAGACVPCDLDDALWGRGR